MHRRNFMLGAGAALGGTALAGNLRASTPEPLVIQKASYALRDTPTLEMISLSPKAPPPVIYGTQGQRMRLPVTNTTPDYTAMHWHGLRIENGMDGVPYLTQMPIAGGETFDYQFTPPDAGTYWYHPHCMTMEQMARGLTGVMVIKEAEDPGFDSDQVVNLRDFRLNDDGTFLPAYTPRGAARAGTFGNVITANWQVDGPAYEHGAGTLVRLRIANTDTTRIHKLYISGAAETRLIAWDGQPLEQLETLPETPMLLAPGQRADIAVLMPKDEGAEVTLNAILPGRPDRAMARLRATGQSANRAMAELKPLPQNPIAKPDLNKAELREFVFGWTPEGTAPNDGLCGTLGYTFWSINRTPWAGDAAQGVGPLATLERGKSYVLRFRNESPNQHPIHLHGLVFVPIRSNKRQLPPHFTDTALLLKDETLDVALMADNPGDWAFHCHVIEHQKTGLTGYIRVT